MGFKLFFFPTSWCWHYQKTLLFYVAVFIAARVRRLQPRRWSQHNLVSFFVICRGSILKIAWCIKNTRTLSLGHMRREYIYLFGFWSFLGCFYFIPLNHRPNTTGRPASQSDGGTIPQERRSLSLATMGEWWWFCRISQVMLGFGDRMLPPVSFIYVIMFYIPIHLVSAGHISVTWSVRHPFD